ncbi:MAG: ABC transporter permease subunit [Tannerella sp.]|jgi:NitT/TauT family transport system permease protein|nr:ABC transporter permease subunit [Tannerella sp.]
MQNKGNYWKSQSRYRLLPAILALGIAFGVNVWTPNVQGVYTVPYQIFLIGFAAVLVILWVVSLFVSTFGLKLYHQAQFITAVGLVLALWDLLTTKSAIIPLPFFPGPAQIVGVMFRERAMLLLSTAYSMRLFFAGLITGTLLGLVTGILIGWYREWNYWLFPLIKITGVIPAIAWMPIAIVIFPNTFITGVFLIAIASWFSVAFMVSTGISSTSKAYYEVARTLGANEAYLLFRIAIPNAVPSIFTGISTATGLSFVTLVVSEMIGAKAGLGWYINWAKGWSAYDKVYACIIIMGVSFSIFLTIITLCRNYFLRWQKGVVL